MKNTLMRDRVISLVLLVALLAVWEFGIGEKLGLLPSPSQIVRAVISDIETGAIWPHLWVTVCEIVVGFLIAVAVGIGLGALIALVPSLERILYPYILVIQIIPKVAVAPLIIIWLGYGLSSIASIVALVAFFPILVNVIAGMKAADAKQIMLMRSLGAGRWQIFCKVRLWNAVPYLFAGLDVAIIFAVIGAIVGEFIGAPSGLGSLIVQRQYSMNVPGVFSAIVFLTITGFVLHWLVKLAARRAAFWAPSDQLQH